MKLIKIIALLMVTLLAFGSLVACGENDSPNAAVGYNTLASEVNTEMVPTTTEAETTPPATEPPTTAEPRLSDTCDKIYASGYDADGNFYELVANETEDYTGLKILIGVIKNNNWSIQLTDSIFGHKAISGREYTYVGNGCFMECAHGKLTGVAPNEHHNAIFLNGNNGLYSKTDYANSMFFIVPTDSIISKEKKILCQPLESGSASTGNSICVLELDSMDYIDTGIPRVDYSRTYAFSEGLMGFVSPTNTELQGFYDIKGNMVIDLSMYDIEYEDNEYPNMSFSNGKCKFIMKNNNGTKYRLSIDKNGNVTNSIEVYD